VRLKFRRVTSPKVIARRKNKVRIRKNLSGSAERPRLSVFKSGRHIYAQIVDDSAGKTLVAASSLDTKTKGKKSEVAKAIGEAIAKKALEKKIKAVVFDRSGYVYHGRVKAVAEGAREGGLSF
jgi:large subunit ribosomal protein L18